MKDQMNMSPASQPVAPMLRLSVALSDEDVQALHAYLQDFAEWARHTAVAPSDAKGNADGLALPVFSVSRYSDTKQRGVLVIFDRRLSDDELRASHDSLTAKGKADAAAAPAQKENQQ